MSPALTSAIDAAERLAWMPTANIGGRKAIVYYERKEAHEELLRRLTVVGRLSANASPELRYLVAAIRRAAACSFSNRWGEAYYERREAIFQLRGCLDAWKRSSVAA